MLMFTLFLHICCSNSKIKDGIAKPAKKYIILCAQIANEPASLLDLSMIVCCHHNPAPT